LKQSQVFLGDNRVEALRIVGQPVARKDGVDIVTGNVVYGVDVSLPGMLYGAIVRSSIASGRINRIDVSRAQVLPGVKAVITTADVPDRRFGYGIKDERFFAADRVRYAGEPVAAIAAVDEESAQDAARLVDIEYEIMPGVFDVIKKLHPHKCRLTAGPPTDRPRHRFL
jgi:carbon-monoxide dehydrogenase large subunit